MEQLKESEKEEAALLKKLVQLELDHPEYIFGLAMTDFRRRKSGIKKLIAISPNDRLGYPPGHLYLAKLFSAPQQLMGVGKVPNARLALQHVDHYLTVNKNNLEAQKLKAEILEVLYNYRAA